MSKEQFVKDKKKHSTDNCYLMYDEDGYLVCDYNHKLGEECLMNRESKELEKAYKNDFVKDKIVEAVPEIMELKFGCQFYDETDYPMTLVDLILDKKDRIIKLRTITCDIQNTRHGTPIDISHYKIIGRPITLEDVLRAGKKLTLYVNSKGQINTKNTLENKWHWCNWHLGKTFDEQPQQTKDFLYDIFK